MLRYLRFLVDGQDAAEAVAEQVFLDAWRAARPGSRGGALVRLAVAVERRGLAAAARGRDPLRDAVLTLPQRERALLLLRFAGGLDGPSVRAATGLAPTRLAALQHRALARLATSASAAVGMADDPVALRGLFAV